MSWKVEQFDCQKSDKGSSLDDPDQDDDHDDEEADGGGESVDGDAGGGLPDTDK